MAEASSDDGDAAAAAAQLREEDEVDARLAFQYEARRQVRTGSCCVHAVSVQQIPVGWPCSKLITLLL